ncbi:MAG: carboxypeptidase-like regulatory domain-containing protein [Ignavibacteriales bacterium]|nr:carboxypeptidase-like regulatory domain-containing protein [Ignavibacteriales bacterium]
MRFSASCLFFLQTFQSVVAQTFTLSGFVRDAETKQPLVAAAIRIVGTSKGTISNAQGEYRISLEPGSHLVTFSYVGYRPDSARIRAAGNTAYNVVLQPAPIQMAEVIISGEDPAIQIMRRVIESKSRWMKSLKTYQFQAFTRQTILRDTSIASIAETYSTGYWQQGDTLREVIKQKRQTANIPAASNIASVGNIVNFYLDEIRFAGFNFVGPTAPDAFDYYDFKLEKTRELAGTKVITIQLNPKSRMMPLFRGSLDVVDDRFVLAGVEVSPNESFAMPFVTDIQLRYSQHFSLYENRFWMPVDIRLNGSAEIGITGVTFPRIGFESLSSIYDYEINIELPDSIFKKPRRTTSAEASSFDSSFWVRHEVLPLTKEEQVAYQKLDSTQTFQRQFQPSGPLTALGEAASTLKYASLRFNRVEGLFLGGNLDFDSTTSFLRTFASLGYGFSDRKGKWNVGTEVFLDSIRSVSFGLEGFHGIGHFPDENFHSDFSNALSTLLSKVDYRDYYYLRGWKVFASFKPLRLLRIDAAFRAEEHRIATQTTNYSLFYKGDFYRTNPSAMEGTLRSISFQARYGQDPILLNIISRDFVECEAEFSPSSFSGDYDFTRLLVRSEYRFTTFLSRVLFPPSFHVKLTAGTSTGALPPQRMFILDSPLLSYAPPGVLRGAGLKEFSGDRFVLLTAEHNFRSTPFLLLDVPFLYKNGIELIVQGTIARSWSRGSFSQPAVNTTNGWYTEAGIGISRIFGLLRLDCTRRFAAPSNWFVTLSVANLF